MMAALRRHGRVAPAWAQPLFAVLVAAVVGLSVAQSGGSSAWDTLAPEAVDLLPGTNPAGSVALLGDTLALRVAADQSGYSAVDLYARRGDAAEGRWLRLRRLEAPAEAAGAFAEELRIGEAALAASFKSGGLSGERSALVLYREEAPGSWVQDQLLDEPGASIGGDGLFSLSRVGDRLSVFVRGAEPTAGPPGALPEVRMYSRGDAAWTIDQALRMDDLDVHALSLSPSGSWLALCGVANNTHLHLRVFANKEYQGDPGADIWHQTDDILVTSGIGSGGVALSFSDNLLAVGANSAVHIYVPGQSLNWQLEASVPSPVAEGEPFTLSIEHPLLLVGGTSAVTVYERQWPKWPEIFQLVRPDGDVSSGSTLPAHVAQSGLAMVIAIAKSGDGDGSVTYLDTTPAYPEVPEIPTGGNSVSIMLRMTGLAITDLTEERLLFLQQGIANVSLSDESHTDHVHIELQEFWEQVFAQVDVTVPVGFERNVIGWSLFDAIRFGELNGVLVAKDPFYETVDLSASSDSDFNPFLAVLEPTIAPTPAPTYAPAPLLQNIDSNSTQDSNQYVKTTKQAFDANPPEQTNNSIIVFSCIGAMALIALILLILLCRKAVMSKMLRREVQAEQEWQYDPYQHAKPKFQALARAQIALAKLHEETAYRKYYAADDGMNSEVS